MYTLGDSSIHSSTWITTDHMEETELIQVPSLAHPFVLLIFVSKDPMTITIAIVFPSVQ